MRIHEGGFSSPRRVDREQMKNVAGPDQGTVSRKREQGTAVQHDRDRR